MILSKDIAPCFAEMQQKLWPYSHKTKGSHAINSDPSALHLAHKYHNRISDVLRAETEHVFGKSYEYTHAQGQTHTRARARARTHTSTHRYELQNENIRGISVIASASGRSSTESKISLQDLGGIISMLVDTVENIPPNSWSDRFHTRQWSQEYPSKIWEGSLICCPSQISQV